MSSIDLGNRANIEGIRLLPNISDVLSKIPCLLLKIEWRFDIEAIQLSNYLVSVIYVQCSINYIICLRHSQGTQALNECFKYTVVAAYWTHFGTRQFESINRMIYGGFSSGSSSSLSPTIFSLNRFDCISPHISSSVTSSVVWTSSSVDRSVGLSTAASTSFGQRMKPPCRKQLRIVILLTIFHASYAKCKPSSTVIFLAIS
ncbi:hypothetical protein AGLY_016619 [Aphis glycines]|uniref:Uncharacterized protein n=1 Tax=Aphis glycines TaxID=307491 RepID=A0A6G0SXV9_APHGL|nr:hypothetical protein AGLY_016619 [Aphis glycines]